MEAVKKSKWRILYWLVLVVSVCIVMEGLGYLGMTLNSRKGDALSNRNYFNIRAMLMGDKSPEMLPRCLTLPYMGYVANPGYTKSGYLQHNEDGYRGDRIPLEKNNNYRILCMGGSTTYGSPIDNPSDTYPAQLNVLVAHHMEKDPHLREKYAGVEVINAGLEGGNSAEELQQYLAKYRYYNADMVILHTGVNDALLFNVPMADFQLDYTHRRRLNFHLEPLPQPARFMLHSYFFSFFTVGLYYGNFSEQQDDFFSRETDTFVKWSDGVDMDSVFRRRDLEHYPFYRNTELLCREIMRDGSALLVMPNALNPNDGMVKSAPKYVEVTTYNDSLLKRIAGETGAVYIPFAFDSIRNPAWWVDDCHMNPDGEKNKAEIVFRHVKHILDNDSTK